MNGYGVYCSDIMIAWFKDKNIAYWYANEQSIYGDNYNTKKTKNTS